MGKLFGGGTKTETTTATRMPDTEDPSVKEAERRRLREDQARSGRASTVLSRQSRSTGGTSGGTGAYSNSLLGQAN